MKPIYRLFKLRLARWRNAVLRCLLPLLVGLAGSAAWAGPPRDRLTLLVPDSAALSSWQVKVWTDSAADEGIQLAIITDSALLAMGTGAAAQIAGLIVPDSAHLRASDALVAAIKQYAYLGGNLMLVYDAGVLNGAGFYPTTGNSRFADMVGVDYVFWNNGLGAATLVGFGPVVGTKARLEALSIPPGKHLPYAAPSSPSLAVSAAYVPTSQYDPGGSELMSELVKKRHKKGIEDGSEGVRAGRPVPLRDLLGLDSEDTSSLRYSGRNASATNALAGHALDRRVRSVDYVDAVFNANGKSYTERSPGAAVPEDNALRVISGYAYGPLNYFHYVTTGTFPGTVFLSSPNHGLVAGQRSYGSGQLLFVNMPLGYFKAIGTDGAPLQGFLNLFARETVGVSTLSVQPAGIGGLIYNWHVDDGDDLNTNVKDLLALKKGANPFKSGPFSIHFTAGPDVIVPGDRKGMDLVNNKKSKDLVKKLLKLKGNNDDDDDDDDDDGNSSKSFHEFGSHGGWIHDYWGMFANEANSPNLTHLLAQNFDAIEDVIGHPIREFSAPVGNTPLWAINWLENRGVVAMYLVGDLGSAMVR